MNAFVHTYARRLEADPQLPPWVGDSLFGRKAAAIDRQLPTYHEVYEPSRRPDRRPEHASQPVPPHGIAALDRDYVGWCQFHTSWYAPDKAYIRSLFQPLPEVEQRFDEAGRILRGKTIVGLHIRRGDYGQMIFYITPVAWYLRLLEELWPTLENPALFVATEDLSLVKEFAEYNPITVADLGIDLKANPLVGYNYLARDLQTKDPIQLDFYPDFYMLSRSDVVIAPNSTFSFAAAMLNPNLKAFYRSNLPFQSFEKIDPWNAYPLTHDDVRDYPHVPGIALTQNSYWS